MYFNLKKQIRFFLINQTRKPQNLSSKQAAESHWQLQSSFRAVFNGIRLCHQGGSSLNVGL